MSSSTESPQYGVLTKWLSGQYSSLDDASNAFCESVEDKYAANQNTQDVQGLLWTSWQAVVAVVAGTDYNSPQRQQLADFLVALTNRPNLSSGNSVCQIDNMTVWRDLPVLGWELREAWNGAASSNSDQTTKDQWVNTNAFTATLVESIHDQAQDRPDYSLFGLWTIRTALEEQGEIPDVSVAAAAAWFIYSAPALWSYCTQNKSFEGKVAKPGSSFAQEDWKGFTQPRWNAWRQNLQDVETAVSNQPAAGLVEQALQAMQSAEDQC